MKKLIKTFVIIHIFIIFMTGQAWASEMQIVCNSAVSIHVDQQEISRIKALVTTGYQGNYTLEWAKANDYQDADKVKWVNIKRYSSKTSHLVWVSIAYQRVNIFSGWKGNWNLTKSFIIGTGVPGRDTPVGVWKLIGKNPDGWTTSAYTVRPVVSFINDKYGFHSRLYYPATTKIRDKSIGFPCSHGCIRMYTEDLTWFYENIPEGTTVVVY